MYNTVNTFIKMNRVKIDKTIKQDSELHFV